MSDDDQNNDDQTQQDRQVDAQNSDGQHDEHQDAADVETLRAEVAKWKSLARKHEDRSKANVAAATELAQLKQSQMSEQERAVEAAKNETRAETLRQFGSRLVDAKFEAVAAGRTVNGRPLDVTVVLEGVDRGYYLTDTGEVDTDKVTRFLDGIAPKPDEGSQQRTLDYGQGRRTLTKASTGEQFAAAVDSFFR